MSNSETISTTSINEGLATVERVLEVTKHSNADKLDIIRVLGYDCIVGRDTYKKGDLVVFIQPDSILPADQPWAQEYLRYTSRGRIRACRLRGEWSMGLVVDIDRTLSRLDSTPVVEGTPIVEGEDVTHWMGITKYEPALPNNTQAKGGLPYNIPRTDETRYQNLRRLSELFGQKVDVTLKMDGQSMTVYCVLPQDNPGGNPEPATGLCSRSLELKVGLDEEGNPFNTNWHKAEQKYNLIENLTKLCTERGVSLALRGEVTGPGIQAHANNPASRDELTFWLYSVYNITDGRYERINDPFYFTKVAEELQLLHVPIIETCELDQETIDHYDHGTKTYDEQPFEGVVVNGDGFSFKIINKWYDQEK